MSHLSSADWSRLRRAIEEAHRSVHRYRMGAVLVRNGTYLGAAANIAKNDPKIIISTLCSVHCEVRALRQTTVAKGATIYVARINRLGEPMMAQPCARCVVTLGAASVQRAVWTTETGGASARMRQLLNPTPIGEPHASCHNA